VDEEGNVYVADPNIPNPTKTVRIVPEDEFYGKWYEKFPDYLVRRPACAIQREITPDGRQVMAKQASRPMHGRLVGIEGVTAPEGSLLMTKDGNLAWRKMGPDKTSWTRQKPVASSPDGWGPTVPPQRDFLGLTKMMRTEGQMFLFEPAEARVASRFEGALVNRVALRYAACNDVKR
jgi:hypothetical protein